MPGRIVCRTFLSACLTGCLVVPMAAGAQNGGFMVKLGADTLSVETWTRSGNRIEGTTIAHSPFTRVITWSVTLNGDGSVASFEQAIMRADGAAIPNSPTVMKMTFLGDTVVRDVTLNGQPGSRRNAVPKGTVPAIAGSWFMYELGMQQARRDGSGALHTIGFPAQQAAAQKFALTFVGVDSVDMDYGGSPFGFRLDNAGRITHGDGSRTTQKFLITTAPQVDTKKVATAWGAKDAAGQVMGIASPRDSLKVTVGGASVVVDYGRPAKRGRSIWGGIVPWGEVWRLGANAATQLITDKDLDIGDTAVPAGKYTLWLLPTANKTLLIVNKQVGQWGTMYDAAQDFARIAVEKRMEGRMSERFTVLYEGDELRFIWDGAGYGVKVRAK